MERQVILMILSLVIVLAMDEDRAELHRILRESCSAETSVDMSLLEAIDKGAELTPDPKLKCYIKCIVETAGMMSDGEMDVEFVLSLLCDEMRQKHEAALRKCGTVKGSDDCDTAYLTQVCWQRTTAPDYYLV